MTFSNYNKTYVDQYIESDLETEKDNFRRSFAERDENWVTSGVLAAHVDELTETLASIGATFPAEWHGNSRNAAIGFIWQVVAKSKDFDVERNILIAELGRKRRDMLRTIPYTNW